MPAVTRTFFRDATPKIEQAVQAEPGPRQRIRVYLVGVGTAMRRHSHAFYDAAQVVASTIDAVQSGVLPKSTPA